MVVVLDIIYWNRRILFTILNKLKQSGGGIGRRQLTDRGNKGMVISHTGSNPVLTTKKCGKLFEFIFK